MPERENDLNGQSPVRCQVKATSELGGSVRALPMVFHQAKTPADESREILVRAFLSSRNFSTLRLQRGLLLGFVEDFENLHREEPIVGVLRLLRFPDFAEPLVARPCARGCRAPAA